MTLEAYLVNSLFHMQGNIMLNFLRENLRDM